MAKKSYTGINIQFPISRLILEGKKIIETRTYPIPNDYIGEELALVETPGKTGNFKSRIIAIIKFGPSFKYRSAKEFYADMDRHCVEPASKWAWDNKLGKWGWPVTVCRSLPKPMVVRKRVGIKYTKNLIVD